MKFNLVNTDSIEVNDDLEIKSIQLGTHSILIIDNVLKNPEYLLSILKNLPMEKNPDTKPQKFKSTHWGHMLPSDWKFTPVRNLFNRCAKTYYNINHVKDIHTEIKLQFNYIPGNIIFNNLNTLPHVDPAFLACSLFITPDEYCHAGTAFFNQKNAGIDYEVSYCDENFKSTKEHKIIYDDYSKIENQEESLPYDSRFINKDIWELKYIAEMKYNRLIIHPSYIFHAAYIEEGWFMDHPRISLAGFVK